MDDTPYQLTRLQLCAQDCPSHLVVVGIQVQVRGAAILLSVVRKQETMKRHLCSHGLESGTSSLVLPCSRCQMLRMQGLSKSVSFFKEHY